MSRYVDVVLALPRLGREELARRLADLGLEIEVPAEGERAMLEGSLECAGEPVDLRVSPGQAGAIEDFGFRLEEGRLVLVCGDLDRKPLTREVVEPLRQALAEQRARARLEAAGYALEETVEADGTRRIRLKR